MSVKSASKLESAASAKNTRRWFQGLVSRVVQWVKGHRKIYGLYTEGNSLNGWKFKMSSKKMFKSRKSAEQHIAEFEKKCCDPEKFEAAEVGSLETKIMEYELHG
jgi:hypothetical protein